MVAWDDDDEEDMDDMDEDGEPMDLGRVVQVDPINPSLKAPGTMCVTPIYDDLLSRIAFSFNRRRYTWAVMPTFLRSTSCWSAAPGGAPEPVGPWHISIATSSTCITNPCPLRG
jgi:hypothetical protein